MSKLAIQYGKSIELPKEYHSLGEMLIYIAKQYPGHGMTFVNISGEEVFLSYVDLLNKATNYLAILTEKGFKNGDIAIVLINNDLMDFYIIFWACILGGIIVAPVNQPSFEANSPTLLKLENVWQLLNKSVLIVEERYKKYYEALKNSSKFTSLVYFTTKDLNQNNNQGLIHHGQLDDIVILQFSSGSTGIPKGVQLTNKNIITNLLAVKNNFEVGSEDNVFTWLPHTHDMGLFLQYLSSVIAGANIFIFSPMTFSRSPYLFLKKVTEHKCSWFGSPNFGLDWSIKNISDDQLADLDFSSLKFILTGSEPISVNIIENFVEKFSRCGMTYSKIRSAYGMAEVTVCATTEKLHHPLRSAEVNRNKILEEAIVERIIENNKYNAAKYVHVGYPIEEISVRIADEQGNTLNENQVGKIQLKGQSTTTGYYNNPDVNSKIFTDGWLNTGDLGYMVDGSLVVTGRMKDIIFIRGQNFFAHDLEEMIFVENLVQRGNLLITGVYNDKLQKEEILIFIKHRSKLENFIILRQQVIDLLRARLALDATHVIPSKIIPKTSSGKLQRYAMQKAYLLGEYDEIINEIDKSISNKNVESINNSLIQDEFENRVRTIWSTVLQIPGSKIGSDDEFFLLGGNSIKAFQMLHLLSKDLHVELDAKMLIICKTIRQIIQFIQSTSDFQNYSNIKQPATRTTKFVKQQAIAITGLALKLPAADSAEEFWNNLITKKDCINKISNHRKKLSNNLAWDEWLGEVTNIEYFDNDFFNITAEEAAIMDPQQRLLLQTSYHALEDAGIMPSLDESLDIGVYSAISLNTYLAMVLDYIKLTDVNNLPSNTLVGNLNNMVSARLSNVYNFTGPSLNIDTACSSALVALHHAVMALRQNIISGALVVSANLLITPEIHALARKAGIISSTKYAKVFDKDADGSILGEGIIAFYLEPLDHAVRMKKNIYGIIRNTAINNNGATYGVMAPNLNGQYQVLLDAYSNADISPNELSYIEVHGTGTAMGDPIEMNALLKLFAKDKNKNSIGVGSVKTNIGHLLSAAGAAGLAKLLLCLKQKTLVPNLNFNQINPYIKLSESPFYIVKDIVPWMTEEHTTRKAGLSSFGFGGTNAHVILEEWNDDDSTLDQATNNSWIATFSAKSESSLELLIAQSKKMIANNLNLDIANLCFTRNRYRNHYSYRAAFLFKDNQLKAIIPYKNNFLARNFLKELNIGILIEDAISSENKLLNYQSAIQKMLLKAGEYQINIKNLDENLVLTLYWDLMLTELQQYLKIPISTVSGNFKDNVDQLKMGDKKISETLSWLKSKEANFNNLSFAYNFEVLFNLCSNNDKSSTNITNDKVKIIRLSSKFSDDYHDQLLCLLGELYVMGLEIDWSKLHPDNSGRIINIPSYPFDSKPYWIKTCL